MTDPIQAFADDQQRLVDALADDERQWRKWQRRWTLHILASWTLLWALVMLIYWQARLRSWSLFVALNVVNFLVQIKMLHGAIRSQRFAKERADNFETARLSVEMVRDQMVAQLREIQAGPTDSQSSPAAPTASAAAPDHSEREPDR